MIAYIAINLNICTELAKVAFPSFSTVSTLEMLAIFDVKGAAIEASEEDSDIPISAALSA